ncbi:MAG: hypothetical protein GTO41_01165, partial [Burkholderiales bacterium]|nr:hypothetical protein [Burkholderiales bacterium]
MPATALSVDHAPASPAATLESHAAAEPESAVTPAPLEEPAVQMYASIGINGKPAGTFLVSRYANGDFAVRETDLSAIGINAISGRIVMLDGEAHLMLSTLEGATFAFDERRVHIAIQIDPSALRDQIIDARRRNAPSDVIYPRDTSAFFNYALSHDDIEYVSDRLSAEAGIHYRNFLLLADGFYERFDGDDRAVRLNTSLTHDNRETLQRTIVGDFIASSGALGSALNLGGISFSKNYRIDPYLVRYPFASYAGLAAAP